MFKKKPLAIGLFALILLVVLGAFIADASAAPRRKIAFVRDGDIWTMNTNGRNQRQLTHDGSSAHPAWSPNGRKIVFDSSRDGFSTKSIKSPQIYVMKINGTKQKRLTNKPKAAMLMPSFSPSGKRIVFKRSTYLCTDYYAHYNAELAILNVKNRNLSIVEKYSDLLEGEEDICGQPFFSPNGKKIFYKSIGEGVGDILVFNFASRKSSRVSLPELPQTKDGQFFAFSIGRKGLKVGKIELSGYGIYGATGKLFVKKAHSPARIIHSSTGRAHLLAEDRPAISPKEQQIAFTVGNWDANKYEIWRINTDGSKARRIADNAAQPAWQP